MLSKKEKEYLEGNLKLSKNYEHKLIHSIRTKLDNFFGVELPLIVDSKVVLGENRLGKLTSYQTKLIPPNSFSIIMIKYLHYNTIVWMQNVLNVKELQF